MEYRKWQGTLVDALALAFESDTESKARTLQRDLTIFFISRTVIESYGFFVGFLILAPRAKELVMRWGLQALGSLVLCFGCCFVMIVLLSSAKSTLFLSSQAMKAQRQLENLSQFHPNSQLVKRLKVGFEGNREDPMVHDFIGLAAEYMDVIEITEMTKAERDRLGIFKTVTLVPRSITFWSASRDLARKWGIEPKSAPIKGESSD